MKNKVLIFALLALVASAGVIGAIKVADAYGGWFGMRGADATPEQIVEHQTQMFERQADMLGVSTEQIKEYWSQGMTMQEILDDLGISQEDWQAKMQEMRKTQMQEHLQILVENGVITQAQADARLEHAGSRGLGFGGHMMGKRGFGMKGGCPFASESTDSN